MAVAAPQQLFPGASLADTGIDHPRAFVDPAHDPDGRSCR